MRFQYNTVDANRTERRLVHPYGLGLVEGNWHMVAFDETRKAQRNFRLDRIKGKVSVEDRKGGAYEVPDDFDISRHVDQQEYEIPDGPEIQVKIALDDVATWLLARRRRGAGTLTRNDDGTGLLEVSIRSEDGLFRWLSEFGQRAHIVEPTRLAVAFAERTRSARDLYDTPVGAR